MAYPNAHPWTPEDDALLREGLSEGWSAATIAKILSRTTPRSRNAVCGRANRLGLTFMKRAANILNKTYQRHDQRGHARPRRHLKPIIKACIPARATDGPAAIAGPLEFTRLGLDDRTIPWPHADGCRAMDGEPAEFRWCNAPRERESLYCPYHSELYHRPYNLTKTDTLGKSGG